MNKHEIEKIMREKMVGKTFTKIQTTEYRYTITEEDILEILEEVEDDADLDNDDCNEIIEEYARYECEWEVGGCDESDNDILNIFNEEE